MAHHQTSLVHRIPRKPAGVRSDINVTPLVDVCLVLLIIFMVVMPAMSRGMEVKLPTTTHHNERKDTGETPIISVKRNEAGRVEVYYDRDAMQTMDVLTKKVTEELRVRPGQRFFLKADTDLTFKDVYPAIMALHEGGSQGIDLGTTEPKEKK